MFLSCLPLLALLATGKNALGFFVEVLRLHPHYIDHLRGGLRPCLSLHHKRLKIIFKDNNSQRHSI